MLARLGRWCFRQRRATLLIWIVVLAGLGVLGNTKASYSTKFEIPASESASGFTVLSTYFPGQAGSGRGSGSIVFEATQGVADPAVKAAMSRMFQVIDDIDGVTVLSPYEGLNAASQINRAGTIAYAPVNLDDSIEQTQMAEIGKRMAAIEPKIDGLTIEVGGAAFAEFKPPESELIGLGFAIIVLILAFGSVLAMGLPIGVALFGVGAGSGVIGLLSTVVTVPDIATTIGAMLGLAVGIDYALFIVTRYRESLHQGKSTEESVVTAMDTAGRAVVFAGITVVVSLLGMLLMGLKFVSGLGMGAATTVAVTLVASITLLPALLGFAAHRVEVTRWRGIIAAGFAAIALFGAGLKVNALLVAAPLALLTIVAGFAVAPLKREVPRRKPKATRDTLSYKWSRLVQHHPWRFLLGGVGVLVLLASPVLGLRLGFSDEGNFGPDTTTRRAYDLLAEGFGPGFNGPLVVAVELSSPADATKLEALANAVAADPGVQFASPAFPNDPASPQAAVMRVIPNTSPQDAATNDTITRLRDVVIPSVVGDSAMKVYVTGSTASAMDFTTYLSERLVLFIGVVLLLSFLLLMMVFRSVLVPLKAVVMNVISIAAAYGVVVAIFQWGWLNSIFGVEPAPIEPFVPMMMFAIVFGLSMDYEVFLLSRVKEEYDRTGDAKGSVADGLAATAHVITAAAAIMIVVFGAFLLEDERTIKLFGLGLAAAVFLDATLVRMLLVPATMELLGEKNWWLPKWLDKVLPRLNVEGPTDHHTVVPDDAGDLDDDSVLTGH